MPNWVANRLKVTNKLDEFRKFINEEGRFDFNRVIQMPEDLSIDSGSGSWKTGKFLAVDTDVQEFQNKIENFVKPIYNSTVTQETFVSRATKSIEENEEIMDLIREEFKYRTDEMLTTLLKGYYNLQTYGYVDWYDWCYDNWGTKWNAHETFIVENSDDCILLEFDTAWSYPQGIMNTLIDLGFNFKLVYSDEDMGSNLGLIEVKDGEVLKDVYFDDEYSLDERFYLANAIHGYISDDEGSYEEQCANCDDYFKPISLERQEELSELVEL